MIIHAALRSDFYLGIAALRLAQASGLLDTWAGDAHSEGISHPRKLTLEGLVVDVFYVLLVPVSYAFHQLFQRISFPSRNAHRPPCDQLVRSPLPLTELPLLSSLQMSLSTLRSPSATPPLSGGLSYSLGSTHGRKWCIKCNRTLPNGKAARDAIRYDALGFPFHRHGCRVVCSPHVPPSPHALHAQSLAAAAQSLSALAATPVPVLPTDVDMDDAQPSFSPLSDQSEEQSLATLPTDSPASAPPDGVSNAEATRPLLDYLPDDLPTAPLDALTPRITLEHYGFALVRSDAERSSFASQIRRLPYHSDSSPDTIGGDVIQHDLSDAHFAAFNQAHKDGGESLCGKYERIMRGVLNELGIANTSLFFLNPKLLVARASIGEQAIHTDSYKGMHAPPTVITVVMYVSEGHMSTAVPRLPWLAMEGALGDLKEAARLWDKTMFHSVPVHPGDVLVFYQRLPHYGVRNQHPDGADRLALFSMFSDSPNPNQDASQFFRWQLFALAYGYQSKEYFDALIADKQQKPLTRWTGPKGKAALERTERELFKARGVLFRYGASANGKPVTIVFSLNNHT